MKKSEIDLESSPEKRIDLLIVAGEHSGDQHAAEILREIGRKHAHVAVAAFGGQALKAAGADLVLDMTKFAEVGLYEVWTKLPFFFKLMSQILRWIKKHRPRVICLVDYPGFNLRLAKALFDAKLSHKAGGDMHVLYYISPQVWAWKPRRRYKLAKFVDKLASILPFEKKCFEGTGLDVSFVGHPFVAKNYDLNLSYSADGPILLLPGSRKAPIKKIFPLLLKSFHEILKDQKERMAIVVYPDDAILAVLRKILNGSFPKLREKVTFIADGESIEASAAIMSSGTMSLKCCLAGIPGAIVYRTHPLTYAIGKLLTNVKFLGLANILLDRGVWREFLQSSLRPKFVAKYILQCLDNENTKSSFALAASEIREILSSDVDVPVSQWLLSSMQ